MSNVIVKENETLDSALRRFKRNCAKAGIQQEIRKREHYEKPSVRRKKKSEAATLYFFLGGEYHENTGEVYPVYGQPGNQGGRYGGIRRER